MSARPSILLRMATRRQCTVSDRQLVATGTMTWPLPPGSRPRDLPGVAPVSRRSAPSTRPATGSAPASAVPPVAWRAASAAATRGLSAPISVPAEKQPAWRCTAAPPTAPKRLRPALSAGRRGGPSDSPVEITSKGRAPARAAARFHGRDVGRPHVGSGMRSGALAELNDEHGLAGLESSPSGPLSDHSLILASCTISNSSRLPARRNGSPRWPQRCVPHANPGLAGEGLATLMSFRSADSRPARTPAPAGQGRHQRAPVDATS